jgi:protein involved in polysaccharide export with SLBB domain
MKIPLYRWGLFLLSFLISLAPASYSASPAPTQEQWQQFQQCHRPSAKRYCVPKRERKRVPSGQWSRPDRQSRARRFRCVWTTNRRIRGDHGGRARVLQPPRLKAGDTVLIRFSRDLLAPLDTSTPEIASPKIYIPEQKLFVLDQFGAITLEKTGRIILKGLNEVEAAERIGAEPTFKGWQVTVKLLPVEEPLKPFGYDLFTGNAKTFAPGTDIPIPADYIVGPNDTVLVQLFGKENAQHELVITRDGDILFPGIGPIQVAGLTFAQMERQIQNRVQKQLIGMKASVTLGQLRSIRVFVLGDAEQPGSYIVSGLSTLTNALLTSSGVKRIGSLRDIQLKRKGKIVLVWICTICYWGDNRADARLQSGDVIFIPSIGKRPESPVVCVVRDLRIERRKPSTI